MNSSIIWDPVIRLFHWSVAAGFIANYALLEEGDPPHEWVGYYILGAVGVRVLWGFIGPTNARFRHFWPTPTRVKAHLEELRTQGMVAHDGHNPVGGAMVITLLLMLVATGVSGWMMDLDAFWGEDWVEELHELLANGTFALVLIHVPVVVYYSRFGPRNLIRQMVTGKVTPR